MLVKGKQKVVKRDDSFGPELPEVSSEIDEDIDDSSKSVKRPS